MLRVKRALVVVLVVGLIGISIASTATGYHISEDELEGGAEYTTYRDAAEAAEEMNESGTLVPDKVMECSRENLGFLGEWKHELGWKNCYTLVEGANATDIRQLSDSEAYWDIDDWNATLSPGGARDLHASENNSNQDFETAIKEDAWKKYTELVANESVTKSKAKQETIEYIDRRAVIRQRDILQHNKPFVNDLYSALNSSDMVYITSSSSCVSGHLVDRNVSLADGTTGTNHTVIYSDCDDEYLSIIQARGSQTNRIQHTGDHDNALSLVNVDESQLLNDEFNEVKNIRDNVVNEISTFDDNINQSEFEELSPEDILTAEEIAQMHANESTPARAALALQSIGADANVSGTAKLNHDGKNYTGLVAPTDPFVEELPSETVNNTTYDGVLREGDEYDPPGMNGRLYVARTDNGKVVHLNPNVTILEIYGVDFLGFDTDEYETLNSSTFGDQIEEREAYEDSLLSGWDSTSGSSGIIPGVNTDLPAWVLGAGALVAMLFVVLAVAVAKGDSNSPLVVSDRSQ